MRKKTKQIKPADKSSTQDATLKKDPHNTRTPNSLLVSNRARHHRRHMIRKSLQAYEDLSFRVYGSGFRIQGLGCRV